MRNEENWLNLVIVGHIDHGKSTLIGSMLLETGSLPAAKLAEIKNISKQHGRDIELAFLADQLKEEREKNITIDTTQIFFQTSQRRYCIIDAPGHVEFIRNMITGSTRADAAVLLIDAHEGMMEQTRRHLYILNLLGVRKIVAAINKMDAVGYRQRVFELRQRELLSFFNTAGIAVPQVIPVSARKGDNILRKSSRMSWYGGEPLLDVLDALTTEVCAKRSFRLPVQDTYRVRGKNILVGRIVSGTVSRGQVVVVLPSRQETVVESIEIFGRVPRRAYEGESIGITLTHLRSAGRGDVIVGRTNLPVVSDRFQSNVFWLAKAPLRLRRPMILQCLTQQVECFAESIPARIDTSSFQVIERNASELKSNEAGCVVLKTVRPLVIERFETAKEMGRFTLEYNGCVAAAGVVL